MRPDLFRDKKGIHVKLKKSTHAGFRKVMFEKDLTMQAAIEEFANLVSRGDAKAMGILDRLVLKRLKEEIVKYTLTEKQPVDELDHATLYHLIGDADSEEPKDEDEGKEEE